MKDHDNDVDEVDDDDDENDAKEAGEEADAEASARENRSAKTARKNSSASGGSVDARTAALDTRFVEDDGDVDAVDVVDEEAAVDDGGCWSGASPRKRINRRSR